MDPETALVIDAFLLGLLFSRAIRAKTGSKRDLSQLAALALVLIAGCPADAGKRPVLHAPVRDRHAAGSGHLRIRRQRPGADLCSRQDKQEGLFWIGGEVNSFFPPKGIYETRALACAGASEPERVLVIGFGGGYTTLFFNAIPSVDEIVVVELLGDIAPFLSAEPGIGPCHAR